MRFVLLLVFFSFSAAAEVICPPELKTDQKIIDAPKGWKEHEEKMNTRQTLVNAFFYDGHPDELASLVPDTDDKAQRNTWNFDKKQKPFVACAYRNTYLQLIKELKVSKCENQYANDWKELKSVTCK